MINDNHVLISQLRYLIRHMYAVLTLTISVNEIVEDLISNYILL